MKVKPYTGEASLNVVVRTVIDALTGKLTLRDNIAAVAVELDWNSARAPISVDWPRAVAPRTVLMLRANRKSDPSSFFSTAGVVWGFEGGQVLIYSLSTIATGEEWSVELLMVED